LTTVDVIVLDLVMPVMDGWTFLDELRRTHDASRLPSIVVASGHHDARRYVGAARLLAKPLSVPVLVRAVSEAGMPQQPARAPRIH